MSRLIKLSLLFVVASLLSTLFLDMSHSAYAVSGSDWRPERIIDDNIFYDNNSMATSDIQSFLNSQVPVCDTGGTKPYNSSMTRAQYSMSQGHNPPYVCMRDYVENPSTHANNLTGAAVPGGISAAQIIKQASDSYGISPRALLVLLQKEQTLVTDDWPWPIQYRSATGYGCPDNNVCESEYYGFYNQVTNAARQFRLYANNAMSYRYKPNQSNYIQYNPNAGCGGTNVYIENVATAGLYNYTPYQPNASALANLYGSGDGCGAYGNRNFWRLFNDWFGRTTADCQSNEQPSAGVVRLYNPTNYQHFYTGYACEASTLVRKGWRYEGILHYQTSASSPYAVVVHRLYNPNTYQHLWATTQEDINNATQNAGFRYEGVAFYAVNSEVPGLVIVHRLYNPNTYQHLWATTQEDINNATQNAGFRYEGVAYYGAPPPSQ